MYVYHDLHIIVTSDFSKYVHSDSFIGLELHLLPGAVHQAVKSNANFVCVGFGSQLGTWEQIRTKFANRGIGLQNSPKHCLRDPRIPTWAAMATAKPRPPPKLAQDCFREGSNDAAWMGKGHVLQLLQSMQPFLHRLCCCHPSASVASCWPGWATQPQAPQQSHHQVLGPQNPELHRQVERHPE